MGSDPESWRLHCGMAIAFLKIVIMIPNLRTLAGVVLAVYLLGVSISTAAPRPQAQAHRRLVSIVRRVRRNWRKQAVGQVQAWPRAVPQSCRQCGRRGSEIQERSESWRQKANQGRCKNWGPDRSGRGRGSGRQRRG